MPIPQKPDPLASLRAKLKDGQVKPAATSQVSAPKGPSGILPVQSSTEGRLIALELVVNALAEKASVPTEVTSKLAALKNGTWARAR